MDAAEAKVQKVLEGSKQFLVPHYQRPYSWEPPQWQTLWRDISELLEDADSKPHFLGSIVFRSEQANRAFEAIAAQRDAIHAELGTSLEWDADGDKRWRTAKLSRPFSLHDRTGWEGGINWVTEYAVLSQRAFAPRIAQLQLGA